MGCAGPGRGGGDRAGGRPQRVSQVQRGGELCGGQRAGKRRVSLNKTNILHTPETELQVCLFISLWF